MSEDWSPCRFIDYSEFLEPEDIISRYGLMFDEFEATQEYLESKGLMGGGYTWHGIVESMIRREAPELNEDLDYNPEGSQFCVRSSNKDALLKALKCIRNALADPAVLDAAIKSADNSIIE